MMSEDPPAVDENHPFYKAVVEASKLEREAMELDTNGDKQGACAKYEDSAKRLNEAVNMHAPRNHPDIPTLKTHREQILNRVKYLQSHTGSSPTSAIDAHIKSVQLTLQASNMMQDAQNKAGGTKRLAAAAGIGAIGGFFVLGGVGAVAGAGAGLFAVTQPGKVGDTARMASDKAIDAGKSAKEYNEKHQITNKALALGQSLVTKGKEFNEKHDVTGKIATGVSTATAKAKEVNEKHDLTGKAGRGISTGMDKITSSLNKDRTSGEPNNPPPSGTR